MKNQFLFSLLLLTGSPVMAGALNLRGADIGDSCQNAISAEAQLGLQAAADPAQMLDTGTLLYTDSSIVGQVTQALYQCRGGNPGTVYSYSVTVVTADEARAASLYATAKAAVVARLGSPQLDSDKLKPADQATFASVPNGPRALSSWDTSHSYAVHVSLQKSASSDSWTVVTSVSPPTPAATLPSS